MASQQKLCSLAVLPPNKTVVFYSPVEGRDVLVRTGVMSEDNSFIHALLHAHSLEYVKSDENDRVKLASRLQLSVSDKLDKNRWDDVSSKLVAQVPFQENIKDLMVDFYKAIQKDRPPKSSKNVYKTLLNDSKTGKNELATYQIICECVPIDQVKTTLTESYSKSGDEKIDKCKAVIFEDFKKMAVKTFEGIGHDLDSARKKYCVDKVMKLIQTVVEEASSNAYKNYLSDLKNKAIPIDTFSLTIFSDRLNRDIYFLDARTRMPYQIGDNNNIKNRKAILLMWVGSSHYEVVGKLLDGSRIQREFYPEDPLIKRINTFLYKPEYVAEQYPNLIPYLSTEEREKIGFFDKSVSKSSHSHSESRSHSEKEESKSDTESEKSSTPPIKHKHSKRRSRQKR